jgi:hypothetical protein
MRWNMNLPFHHRLLHVPNISLISLFWEVNLIALWEIWKI